MAISLHRLALAASTGLALLAGSAQAADLGRPMPAPMAEAQPVYPTLWTGLYVGGHAGYGWGDADGDYAAPFPAAGSYSNSVDGFLGGVQIGYNWQALAWVFGVEADFAWTGADGSSTLAFAGPPASTFSTQMNWMSTVRGRIGWAPDRWMVYGTGGLAFASYDVDVVTDGVGATSDSTTQLGWTLGAGLEYAMTDALRLGLEYKYADFGDETFAAPSGGTTNVDFDVHSVSLRLNYRF